MTEPHDTLKVDLYVDHKLRSRDESLPLYFRRNDSGSPPTVDLIAAARNQLAGVCQAIASIFRAKTRPNKLDSLGWTLKPTFAVSFASLQELKQLYLAINFTLPSLPPPLTVEELRGPSTTKFVKCTDDQLIVTLYKKGVLFAQNRVIPLHYEYQNVSRVDLVPAILNALGEKSKYSIQVWTIRKGYEKGRLIDWRNRALYDSYVLNCAEVRSMIKEDYVAINLLPQEGGYKCTICDTLTYLVDEEKATFFCSEACRSTV